MHGTEYFAIPVRCTEQICIIWNAAYHVQRIRTFNVFQQRI